MEFLAVIAILGLPILLLVTGIVLIRKRAIRSKNIWLGIGCLALFALSLPVFIPAVFLTILLLTGGSFGA